MPIQTHNIVKGIPPRVHGPKSTKPKPSTGKKGVVIKVAQTNKNHKLHASESGDDSKELSQSEEELPRLFVAIWNTPLL